MLSDAQWARIESLMPSSDGQRGRPFRDHRQVVEAIIYRYRCGIAWRDLPEGFGPWQTVWKRHRRFSADGTWDRIHARLLAEADAEGGIDWSVSVDSTINRAHQHATNLPRATTVDVEVAASPGGNTGAEPNDKNRGGRGTKPLKPVAPLLADGLRLEPSDHAIGRSRGGLSTKIHQLVDGTGLPLVVIVGAGQSGDSPVFAHLLAGLSVPRVGPGRPRSRPVAVLGDKAYSSRANRAMLRRRGIRAVIAEPSDQAGHRRRRGSAGGRPPAFDTDAYKGRNVVERSFNNVKQWRGLATRYDKLAIVYRGAAVLRAIVLWLRQ
ncbi:DDE transposase [Arsenicicoccus piscis]|uniref:DDE transposase n=1 Tax=Arsenicicoccus piscis TaxID=673954 RepID=A0ABQ6HMC5_9MICO|nr:DDE transposase [Arsenicicoccus piscis]